MEAAKTLDMLQPRFIGNSTLTPKLFMKWKKTRLPFHFSTIRVSNCSFRLGPNPYGDLPEFRRENTAVDKKSLLQWSPTGRKIVESLEVKLSDDKKREHILISLADLDAEETAITIHRGLEETGRKEKPKIKFQRSFSLTSLRGGRVAWERMQFAQEAIHDPKILADSKERFKKLLGQANPDMKQLQKEVSILEMSGEEDEAIEMLQEAMQRAKEDKKKEGPDLQLAHDLEMLVVEMLIYQWHNKLTCTF
ncbi:hypothetical protein AMTR_s00096p00164340 [Amborella trichopoda]|uniref:Uncharacterized protein n=1 Tax=Amborella trichopoda TaxID=13333 RepID=W1NXU5_AMBTC|nr:hypothetical protein AMTR_s00096p00164340 [Amborella trichopoda]